MPGAISPAHAAARLSVRVRFPSPSAARQRPWVFSIEELRATGLFMRLENARRAYPSSFRKPVELGDGGRGAAPTGTAAPGAN
jgi:hypothetical protein